MSLRAYKSRRDFKATKEPPAIVKKRNRGALIFVIQKHDASHLHYDFRLEQNSVLRSWAIPKQPSNSGIKRLAVETEDHPLDYANFEGEIPKGEYGGGTVEIWDKGIWIPESVESDKIVFTLKGKKLTGKFVLIKFKNQKKNWLFFKLK
ncbi:3'-phosphoesterase [Candidatus Falkowbacteria bacterium]|nr:3'-phosphoesterase [Candidatus Falkowbacteria bacterium]